MSGNELIPQTEVVEIRQPRLTREELIRQLREYGCPERILSQLLEWHFDYLIDNTKLGAWIKNSEAGL